MSELARLLHYYGNEPVQHPTLTLEVQGLADAPQALARLREIMRGVLSIPAVLWREDDADAWVAYLPAWFVDSMTRFTPAEISARPGQWHYESWVAALVDRQWAWWGAATGPDGSLRVTIIGFDLVYNFEPLVYALRVSGGLDSSAPVLVQEHFGLQAGKKKPAQPLLRRLFRWFRS